jgi:hypothetical protein
MLAIVAVLFGIGRYVVIQMNDAERRDAEHWRHEAEESWSGKCHDESWLLATTAGSPDRATCPHRLHRMRVQVATHPSNEEAAALVFCECAREQGSVELEKPTVQP